MLRWRGLPIQLFVLTILPLTLLLLVIAFGTDQVRRAGSMISNDVLKTIVVGLLMLIIPSIVIGILFATIVGIPLALVVAILWGLVLFLGQVVVGTWIGERILPRSRNAARPYGAAFLGVLILILLSWTGVVPLLAGIFGTGAVTLAGWRMLRGGGVPPVPPGYGDQYGQFIDALKVGQGTANSAGQNAMAAGNAVGGYVATVRMLEMFHTSKPAQESSTGAQ